MTSGRTIWQAQDVGWWRRERIVLLGEQFGSEGPSVANWLECEAKAQNAAGRVKAGYATAARGTFLTGGAARAREIVQSAVEIGFLAEFEEGDRTFTATVAAYDSDQGRGWDSLRKAWQRAENHDPDSPGHGGTPSRSVPGNRHTEEKRTEETPSSSELDGARLENALFAYWQQQCGHGHAKFTRDRRAKIRGRLKEGYTPEQIRQGIDGAARAAFTNDAGKTFDDLELICRNGSKLEDFIARTNTTNNERAAFNAGSFVNAINTSGDAA